MYAMAPVARAECVRTTDGEDLVEQLDRLRAKIMVGDNGHCFVERERILAQTAREIDAVPATCRYAHTLEKLLAQLSTPIEPEDIFLGRMIEGTWPEDQERAPRLPYFGSMGHTTLDWPTLLDKGLDHTLKKVGEESTEVVLAAKAESDDRLAEEVADLLFHLSAALSQRTLTLTDALEVLKKRRVV